MNDDKNKPTPGGQAGPTPNRDKPREAPIIDARPGDVKEIKPDVAAKSSVPPAGAGSAAQGKPAGSAASAVKPADTKPADAKVSDAKSSDAKGPEQKSPAGQTMRGPQTAQQGAPAAGKSGGNLGSMTGAGLAGAIVALAGAWGLGLAGGGSGVTLLEDRIKAMETTQAAQGPVIEAAQKSAGAFGDLEKRLTGLEAALRQQAALSNTLKSDVGKLAAGTGAPAVDLKPFEARVAALEKLMNDAKSSVRATTDPETKQAQGSTAGGGVVQSFADTIGKLQTRLAALEKKVQPAADLGPLNARVADLAKRIAPLESRIANAIMPVTQAIEKSGASIAGNTKAIAQTDQKIGASIERSNAAARAIIARALSERVQAGQPFVDELSAVEATGGNAQHVAVLKPLAAKGVLSQQSMLRAFVALEKIIVQAPKAAADAPMFERLKQGALGLVKIRPVDTAQGETPGALFVRIREGLAAGENEAALALFGKLPDDVRKAADSFLQALKARIGADKATQAIASEAIAQLQKQKT